MNKQEIINALSELLNRGIATVKSEIIFKVIEAAKAAAPSFVICGGYYDTNAKTQVLYVDNFRNINR